jgi:hypothetical protein
MMNPHCREFREPRVIDLPDVREASDIFVVSFIIYPTLNESLDIILAIDKPI